MSLSKPNQISVPFASTGLKNTIPPNADNVTGKAGYDQGFPPINMIAKVAGGTPPFGQDMNGILFDVDKAIQYMQAGMAYPYDAAFATAIGGYNLGARVLRSDGLGDWINTVNNNTSDPDAGGFGWAPAFTYGVANVSMTNANVTLTAAQAGFSIILITGTITANLNLIFPRYRQTWTVLNFTTGAFTITAKTSTGSGVVVSQGTGTEIVGDGTNIYTASPASLAISSTAQAQGWTDNTTALSPLRLAEAFKGANQTLSANGVQKLPGGLILQWGLTSAVNGVTNRPFVTTFPNNCFQVIPIYKNVSGPYYGVSVDSFTTSGFVAKETNGTSSSFAVSYIAIGN